MRVSPRASADGGVKTREVGQLFPRDGGRLQFQDLPARTLVSADLPRRGRRKGRTFPIQDARPMLGSFEKEMEKGARDGLK
jgi:hypothetical protein